MTGIARIRRLVRHGVRKSRRIGLILIAAATPLALMPPRAGAQSGETGGIGGTGVRGAIHGEETGGIGGTGVGGTGVRGESGGIGGTGAPIVGFGPIQRFGSVFVNGREYRVTGRTLVSIDGQPATVASLRVGDMAIVRGIATGRHRGFARFISTWQSIVGPVARVAPNGRRFTVLGQTVTAPAGTPGFGDIRPGVTAGVSAQRQANGTWIATNVTILPPSSRFRLETTVAAIRRDRVMLGGLSLQARPSVLADIHAGERVVATGTISDGRLSLTALTPRPISLGAPGTRVEMRNFFRSGGGGRLIAADGIEATGAPGGKMLSGLEPTEIDGRVEADGTIAIASISVDVPEQPVTTEQGGGRDGVPEIHEKSERSGAVEAREPQAAQSEPGESSTKAEPPRNVEPPEVSEPSEVNEPEIETPEIELPEQQTPEPDIDAPEVEPPSDR